MTERDEGATGGALPGKVDTGFPSGSATASAVILTPTAVILTLTVVILGLVPRIYSRRRIPRRALVDPRHKGEDDGARRGCDWRRASRKSGHRFSVRKRSSLRLHPHPHRRHPHPHRRHPRPHRRHPRACPEDLQSAPHPRRALVDPRHKGEDDGTRRGCDWRRASRKSGHRFSVRKRSSLRLHPHPHRLHPHPHRRHPHPHRRHPRPHRRHPRACPEDLQSAPHPRRALVDPRHKGEDDGARGRRGCEWRRASRKSGNRFSVRKRIKTRR